MSELLKILQDMKNQHSKEDGAKMPFPAEEAQSDALDEYMGAVIERQQSPLKVGDYVRLNKWGKMRYNYPRDGQIAQVTRVFQPLFDEDRYIADVSVAMVFSKHGVRELLYDSNALEKVTMPKH